MVVKNILQYYPVNIRQIYTGYRIVPDVQILPDTGIRIRHIPTLIGVGWIRRRKHLSQKIKSGENKGLEKIGQIISDIADSKDN
jgi:hypothetical protein